MSEATTLEQWSSIPARTLVMSDPGTRRPLREILELLAEACPHWRFHAMPGGGHMAPLTRPELVNPVIREFLDAPAS